MDKNVIEKNSIKILIGLMMELLNNPFITSFIDIQLKINAQNAPSRHMSQYVLNALFLISIFGKNKIEIISSKHVDNEIIMVPIISFPFCQN